jgi:hypothetical protein
MRFARRSKSPSASIRMLVSRATGIANYVRRRVHGFLQFFCFFFRKFDVVEQVNNLIAAGANFGSNHRDRLSMTLNLRCFAVLDDAVEHGLALVGELGGRYFHITKIPILPKMATLNSPTRYMRNMRKLDVHANRI